MGAQNADLDLHHHVEPTGVLGRATELQSPGIASAGAQHTLTD